LSREREVQYRTLNRVSLPHRHLQQPLYYCSHSDISSMVLSSEDSGHDVVSQPHHDFLTARTIQITSENNLRQLITSKSGNDKKSRIIRLCLDLESELEEICLLMHETPNTNLFRRVDGLKLRKNLGSIVESIGILVEDQALDVPEDSRYERLRKVFGLSAAACVSTQLR
jgi:hypothetical protein